MNLLVPCRLLAAATAIGSTSTVTTPSVDLQLCDRPEALNMKLASPGVADIKIQMQTSPDNVLWSAAADNPDILSSSATAFTTPTDFQTIAMPNPLARFVRFVLTGINSNNAGTTIQLDLVLREKL